MGAGAWTGALQKIFEAFMVAHTSQQKWDKSKRTIRVLLVLVLKGGPLALKPLLKALSVTWVSN